MKKINEAERLEQMTQYERPFWERGIAVAGMDEVGRGPLAGPVVAACVILPPGFVTEGVNDSKKLSEKKRGALYERIVSEAVSYGIAFAGVEEIERLNILNATFLAMNRAIAQLSVPPQLALIDGNRDHGRCASIDLPHETVVGGDGRSISIAAASILAKVTRDRYVTEVLDKEYPQYHFAQHKGYGTKLHYEMLDKYGPCPEHRRSFLKKWEAKR